MNHGFLNKKVLHLWGVVVTEWFSSEISPQYFIIDRSRVFKALHPYSTNQTSMKKVFISKGLTSTLTASKCQSSMINISN